jgi:3-hydroxypropanoate dehydrogenase
LRGRRDFFLSANMMSKWLCLLGYGDLSVLLPRLPRPSFDEIAKII